MVWQSAEITVISRGAASGEMLSVVVVLRHQERAGVQQDNDSGLFQEHPSSYYMEMKRTFTTEGQSPWSLLSVFQEMPFRPWLELAVFSTKMHTRKDSPNFRYNKAHFLQRQKPLQKYLMLSLGRRRRPRGPDGV